MGVGAEFPGREVSNSSRSWAETTSSLLLRPGCSSFQTLPPARPTTQKQQTNHRKEGERGLPVTVMVTVMMLIPREKRRERKKKEKQKQKQMQMQMQISRRR